MSHSGWVGRRVLFLSGTDGDTRRYRCEYQAEQLRMLGAYAPVCGIEDADLSELLDVLPDIVVFHRLGWTEEVGRFAGRLAELGAALVYDSDDLVFTPDAASLVTWPPDATEAQRRQLFEAQRTMLMTCGRASFSTEPLARAAAPLVRTALIPNVVGADMLREADAALAAPSVDGGRVTLAYLSGTPTHQGDFGVVADVILEMLDRYPQTSFLGVGYLDLDERFDRFGARVERLPFQPREELPRILRRVAVNLAPLESANVFAEAKSAIKFLEAAIVRVPTVASSTPDFKRVIQDGRNGFLAEDADGWRRSLAHLIEDEATRRSVGAEAARFVRTEATTAAHAAELGATLAALADLDVGETNDSEHRVPGYVRVLQRQLRDAENKLGELRRELREAELALAEAADARTTAESLERELDFARREAAAAMRHVAALQATLSWRVTRPLRMLRRLRPRRTSSAVGDRGGEGVKAPPRAAVLFVSGAPEVSMRYRCEHQAEQVRLRGGTATIIRHGEADLLEALERHELVVLHRVAWGPDVEELRRRARETGKQVVFDTDDLVFDVDALSDVAALEDLPEEEARLYEEGLHRYRRTLESCDAVVTSTEPLARRAREHCKHATVAPNVASLAMVEAAERALRRSRPSNGTVIGYMSGTNTHKRDFRVAAEPLLDVLREEPAVRVMIVGPLPLDDVFDHVRDRIERLDMQPWSRLPHVQAGADINLAPLEPDNRFTESKSAIKWIEAGLVGVPTVASPQPDFRRVVRHGENGFLAETADEWRRDLLTLVRDASLRRRVGETARSEILAAHTTKVRAPFYEAQLREIAPRPAGPLTLNWIMYSPIRRNSGGYRNIFRIANILGARGHVQRFIVLPVAHLAGKSQSAVSDFVDKTFGIPPNGTVLLGHDQIPAADVSIATYWPTAYTVAAHEQSLFKAYFIQDFEPEFLPDDDPDHARARGTYDLPLRHICLGRHMQLHIEETTGLPAETVDFALDPVFRLERPPGQRNDPSRILYFARPSLRRRGYAVGVEALRRLKLARPEVEVVFFGSSADELGDVPFPFRSLGVLDASGVAQAMNDADILLTFSLTNISNVPFEGMACGCAVVDLDLPNVSTMVEPGTCFLAPFEPQALADALQTLVADPVLRAQLGARGAESVRTRTWERTAGMFESALRATTFVGAATL